MAYKVIYEGGVFKPIEPIKKIREGEKLDIEIKPNINRWRGAIKDLKLTSVELQHKAKEYWSDRYVSH